MEGPIHLGDGRLGRRAAFVGRIDELAQGGPGAPDPPDRPFVRGALRGRPGGALGVDEPVVMQPVEGVPG